MSPCAKMCHITWLRHCRYVLTKSLGGGITLDFLGEPIRYLFYILTHFDFVFSSSKQCSGEYLGSPIGSSQDFGVRHNHEMLPPVLQHKGSLGHPGAAGSQATPGDFGGTMWHQE